MVKERRLRDTPIYVILQNILSHYECPSDCQAYCCKIQDVEMDMKDLKALCNVSKTKTADLDSALINGVLYYKLNFPCSFLSEINKCEAYKHRPTVCRIYPFNCNSELEKISINPCKMGVSILKDIFEHYKEVLYLPLPTNAIKDLNESSDIFQKDIGGGSKIKFFAFSVDYLKIFSEYLDSK